MQAKDSYSTTTALSSRVSLHDSVSPQRACDLSSSLLFQHNILHFIFHWHTLYLGLAFYLCMTFVPQQQHRLASPLIMVPGFTICT
jgi:hypothetical protein